MINNISHNEESRTQTTTWAKPQLTVVPLKAALAGNAGGTDAVTGAMPTATS